MRRFRTLWGSGDPSALPSVVELTTYPGGIFKRGDRLDVDGRIAVVDRVDSNTTVTLRWRSAWYWRVLYWLREWWLFLFIVPILFGVSFWIWRAMILWVVGS